MANFDSNNWYQLYVAGNEEESFWGGNLWNKGRTGAVMFNDTQLEKEENRWQIFAINSTTYVLRTLAGGPKALLGTMYFEGEKDVPGKTVGVMVRDDIADDSVYWTFSPWGDGTFYMTNARNGTAWHLHKKKNGLLAMNSNITAPQPGQQWTAKPIEHAIINLGGYSTVGVSRKYVLVNRNY